MSVGSFSSLLGADLSKFATRLSAATEIAELFPSRGDDLHTGDESDVLDIKS